MLLLRHGADPWRQPVVRIAGFDVVSDSDHRINANLSPVSMEMAFRIAREGHYRGGGEAEVDAVIGAYAALAEQLAGVSGPEALHGVWMFQKVVPLVLEQTGRPAEGDIATVLGMEVPDGTGGFWLAPGEIWSPDIEAQRPLDDNQFGRERWDDH